jgi:glycosyltransferase involved in cell wall biosynthesis
MSIPQISVIIPAYNCASTIRETLGSVFQQTYQDFEVLVINDGSTDETPQILADIQDPRFKVFSYPNEGLAAARNRGITQAQAELITFLDADDLWAADKLELQLNALQQNPDAGLAYSWTLFMSEDGQNVTPDRSCTYAGDVLPTLLVDNFIASGSNVMLRRSVVETVGFFDETLASVEDWDYWLRVATHYSFAVVPKHQVFYRQSSGSLSSKVDLMEECYLRVIENAFQAAPAEIQPLRQQSLAFAYQYCMELHLKNPKTIIDLQQAAYRLQQAFQFSPKIVLHPKTLRLILKLLVMAAVTPALTRHLIAGKRHLKQVLSGIE